MKQLATLFIGLLALAGAASGQVVYFSQNFNSSSTVSHYVSTTPSTGQFNSISSSGAGTVVSITNSKLQFARTGNAGSFSRTTNFSPVPAVVVYSFKLSVTGNSAAQTTAAVFQVGSGFGTANSAESNAITYARLGVNFTATAGRFSIRDITNSTSSSEFDGEQTLTWVLNNSSENISYHSPDGTNHSLASDKADLWVGTTQVWNDVNIQTTTQTISNLGNWCSSL